MQKSRVGAGDREPVGHRGGVPRMRSKSRNDEDGDE